MSAKPSNLVLLLRLLDNDLPALVAEQLHARIQAEPELATLFRQIQNCSAVPSQAHVSDSSEDEIDSDLLSGFLNQSLPQSEIRAIEHRCLHSLALLSRIVSRWRENRISADARIASDTPGAGLGSVDRQPAPDKLPPDQHDAAAASASSGPGQRTQNPSQTSAPAAERPQVPSGETANSPSSKRRRSLLFLFLTTSVMAFLVLRFLFNNLPRQPLAQPALPGNSATDGITTPQSPGRQDVAANTGDAAQRPAAEDLKGQPNASLTLPGSRLEVPPVRIPRQPDTPSSSAAAGKLVEWSVVTGVAAARPAGRTNWRGVFSTSAQHLWTTTQPSQLLTLSWSRAEGELLGGSTITVDAGTLLEIAAVPKSVLTLSAEEPPPVALITLLQGRVAIGGMQAGQRLLVKIGRQQFDFRATAESTFALERTGGETVIAAYRGELLAAIGPLSRLNWASVNDTGQMRLFRPLRRTEWFRNTERPDQLSDSFGATINRADEFSSAAATAAEPAQAPTPEIQRISVEAALYAATADSNVIPRQLAGELSTAPEEWKRTGLISWLLARFQRDVQAGEASLREVCLAQRTPAVTTFAMIRWFQSAALNQTPATAQLTELVEGLRGSAPLFTRQCAYWFLQQILNDSLPLYSVDQPERRAGIADITEKVQRWQELNR